LKIPAGSVNGLRLKIAGKGDAGRRGGFPGDLYVRLLVRPHPLFERHGDDILSELPVSITQATLGTELEVPTVRGSHKLKVPTGIQTGTVLKLKGEGAPNLQSGAIGDQLLYVAVQVPTKLSKEQKELLIKLAESWGEPVDRASKGTLKKIKDAFHKDE
jgi:molecular chaperone DnaJ